jgi:TRAP-type C4-dicarboxylate transport system permease small subunit
VQRAAQAVERWLARFTSALLAAMVLVILLQVVFRYALNLSLAWTEEVGRYLFVWVCLFGASLAYRLGQHSGYESLVRALPGGAARAVAIGVHLLVAVFAIVLVVASKELIEGGMGQFTPATQIRIGYVYLAFPLSALPTLLFVADALRARGQPPAAGEPEPSHVV